MDKKIERKLSVIFPGIGYNQDKPLLYYASKLSKKAGREVVNVPYKGFPENVFSDDRLKKKCFEMGLEQAEEILKDVDFSEYDDILFISKSVGTAISGEYAKRHHLKVRNVLLTPVERTFFHVEGECIAFHGTNDPWVETDIVKESCSKLSIPLTIINDANHSLETGDVDTDIKILTYVMGKLQEYI